MTRREQKIIRLVLEYLHALDGGQATELQIHANAFAEFEGPKPSAAELSAALKNCDIRRWILGVRAKFDERTMKWNITDAGESVRLELNE